MEDDMWAVLMAIAQLAGANEDARSWVARGEEPHWNIRDERGRWTLHVAGRPAASLVPGPWQDSPAGRRLTGTIGHGRFTMLASFGLCREAGAHPSMHSSRFVMLTLPDGVVLRGCLNEHRIAY